MPTEPPFPRSVPTSETGYTSETSSNGWWNSPDTEETPELRWPDSIRVFDQMRRQDPQVVSVLRAVWLPVQSTGWRIDPAGARDEVVKFVADNLGLPIKGEEQTEPPPRTRDRFSWQQHLQDVRTMLWAGHSYFEQVYRLDSFGRFQLRKLAPRMPRTITQVNVAPDGGLVSIEQNPPPQATPSSAISLEKVTIGVERLVAYVHEREGGNWLGMSLLRPAYKNWLLKDRLLRIQTQMIERNGMGVPKYTAAAEEANLDAGTQIVQDFRAGPTAGAAIPNGAELELMGVTGTLPDIDAVIRYHDEQIARAVLAHFLNLGTQTGSWALGTTFADFFTQSLQSIAQLVADTGSMHVVEDLVDVNFGPEEPAPLIVFDPIGSRQQATAAALAQLLAAGALSNDPTLEQAIRQDFGLPARAAGTGPAPAPPAPTEGDPA